jgi:hypothetical protein
MTSSQTPSEAVQRPVDERIERYEQLLIRTGRATKEDAYCFIVNAIDAARMLVGTR